MQSDLAATTTAAPAAASGAILAAWRPSKRLRRRLMLGGGLGFEDAWASAARPTPVGSARATPTLPVTPGQMERYDIAATNSAAAAAEFW